MDPNPVAVVGVLVVVVLVGAGPLTGVDATGPGAATVGEGNATVDAVTVDASALAVTDGRFGAADSYVRMPTVTVTLGSVTGRPRVVYTVSVPGLDVDRTETRVVTGPGTYRLAPDDRALAPDTTASRYDATLTVHVQSFSTSRTVLGHNTTVEVAT